MIVLEHYSTHGARGRSPKLQKELHMAKCDSPSPSSSCTGITISVQGRIVVLYFTKTNDMVLREKRISNKSDVVQLHLSFGLPDIKAMLKAYANSLATGGIEWAKNLQHTEGDVIYFFEHYHGAFLNYPDKWRVQLSRWAFAVAVRNELLLPSATKDNCYYLADFLFSRRGRPAKKDR